jgi:phytoene dehydrogenase-like protein
MAAHSILPLDQASSAAAALVLLLMGHSSGWGFPKGGSQRLAGALANCFLRLGGEIQTGWAVRRLEELPQARATLLDLGPRQLLSLASNKKLPVAYCRQLQRYRYGPGICKLDWALSAPIPFLAEECRRAGTVHLGGSQSEIAASENLAHQGTSSNKPFVLLAQPSLFDSSRAPSGKHTAWAYCHVPSGSGVDMTEAIESQVERFAPGFRSLVLARHVMTAPELEEYNPNCVGGDISGGIMNLRQLFARPTLRYPPYRTALHGIYLCSSSTPPGPAVHGLCGYHAARRALRDVFGMR